MDNDGGLFIRKTYKIVTLYMHILINFLSVIHIHKTVTIQHKFSRVFFKFFYFKICDLINVKLIRNGNVYYSSIIPIDQSDILSSFYQLWY